jgi:hypothetical protein
MAIRRTRTVDLISLEISDEYGVEVRVRGRRRPIKLDVEEATQLAEELYEIATAATLKAQQDQREPVTHGFDRDVPLLGFSRERIGTVSEVISTDEGVEIRGRIDPISARQLGIVQPLSVSIEDPHICRDCAEGKHGACNGEALVDQAGEVVSVSCGCSHGEQEAEGA